MTIDPLGAAGADPAPTRRIAVVGNITTVVEALAVALDAQSGLEVASAHVTDEEILEVISDDYADVVVLYLHAPDNRAIEVVDDLSRKAPGVRTVLLASQPTIQFLAQAAAAGAVACLSLDARLRDIVDAIRADSVDTMLVDATTLLSAGPHPPAMDPGAGSTPLTRRELEVLALLAEGYSPPVIAARLVISIYTARGHVKNVLRKLGVHSQLEAVATARRLGLLRPPAPVANSVDAEAARHGRHLTIAAEDDGELLSWCGHA